MQKFKRICLRITPGRIFAAILMAASAMNLIIVKAAFDASSVTASPSIDPALTASNLTATYSFDTATMDQAISSTSPPMLTATLTPEDTVTVTPSEAPTFTVTNAPTSTVCTPRSDWFIYIVQPGDTLSRIARNTNTTSLEIKLANCLISDLIFPGQRVYVPQLPVTPTPTSSITPIPPADLVITDFQVTGLAQHIAKSGIIGVPISVTVQNQGGTVAVNFKLSAHYSLSDRTLTAPFTVSGQADSPYPFVITPLGAGQETVVTGWMIFSEKLQGQVVTFGVLADSCSGDELIPAYCRVIESNEGNNESRLIPFRLPANSPPNVYITLPQTNVSYAFNNYDKQLGLYYIVISLSGSAIGPEDGVLNGSSLVWTTDRTDIQSGTLGSGNSIGVVLYANDCRGHTITLTATDSDGNVVHATRTIDVAGCIG